MVSSADLIWGTTYNLFGSDVVPNQTPELLNADPIHKALEAEWVTAKKSHSAEVEVEAGVLVDCE